MASVDEQILTLMESKAATILVANGYETNVVTVARAIDPQIPHHLPAASHPSIFLAVVARSKRNHLRGAIETQMRVRWLCGTHGAGPPPAHAALAALVRDVHKLVAANLRWNDGSSNLAVRTWFVEDEPHELEVDIVPVSNEVFVEVLFRSSVTNPDTVAAI